VLTSTVPHKGPRPVLAWAHGTTGVVPKCAPSLLISIATSMALKTSIFDTNPATGSLGLRLSENSPNGLIRAPLLIAQGDSDSRVVPSVQARFVRRLCAEGQSLQYRTYRGRDHVGVVGKGSPLIPDLLRWTDERFAGKPQAHGCQTFSG